MRRCIATFVAAVAIWSAGAALGADVSPDLISAAKDTLKAALGDGQQDAQILRGLKATADKDLIPFFEALCRSGDRMKRLFAVVTLTEMAGKDANAVMQQRYLEDPDVGIRGVALNHLAEHDGAADADLSRAWAAGRTASSWLPPARPSNAGRVPSRWRSSAPWPNATTRTSVRWPS